MKKFVLSLAVALNLAASGIPVYDGAAFGQRQTEFFEQVKTWLEEADRWVRTTQHYKNQIDAYAKELATKTGIRDAVAFVEELKDIYAQAKSLKGSIMGISGAYGNESELSPKEKELMDKFLKYDYCDDKLIEKDQQTICRQKRQDTFKEVQFYIERSEDISDHVSTINKLSKKLKNSKDIKESVDIGNAIQTQVALLEAEKTQIEIYQLTRQRQKDALKEQERELYLKGEAQPVGLSFRGK